MHTEMRRSGFTLIEVLVVITIIGLLSSTILVGLDNARRRARDARRISDLRQIQNGLENYFSSAHTYPNSDELYNALSGLPNDPLSGTYGYYRINTGAYILGACLENERPTEVQSYSQPDAADYEVSPKGSSLRVPLQCNCGSANAYCVFNGL